MAEPYVGEVRMVSFNFAPPGWALCDGQLLPIITNTALFSILNNFFGGDGIATFALPDLRGRAPIHPSDTLAAVVGATGGSETVALSVQELPVHGHMLRGSVDQAKSNIADGNVFAAKPRRGVDVYAPPTALVGIQGLSGGGGTTPHDNMQPYLVVNFIIALQGTQPVPS